MCGIVGVVGQEPAAPVLMEGLKRLEYRGYDSAGVATLVNGSIDRRRAEGKLLNLQALLDQAPLPGDIGIGHTRWATHGVPNEVNALFSIELSEEAGPTEHVRYQPHRENAREQFDRLLRIMFDGGAGN